MPAMLSIRLAAAIALLTAAGWLPPAGAEPYLAVENGLHCRNCHTNPSGGGQRNVFGTTFARTQLAERIIFPREQGSGWTGEVHERVAVGGNLRGAWSDIDVPRAPGRTDTGITRGTLYTEIRAVPDLVSFYFDYRLTPGETTQRETYALVTPSNGKFTIKAGQFFLPFGLRLEDDSAFVRQRSGINFNTPDDGIEVGFELPSWSVQAAVTNGTAGGGSAPGRRQLSLSAARVEPSWRAGASFNLNQDDLGDRQMFALFGGLKTGPITWLAEYDFITDKSPGGPDNDIRASLIEGNLRIAKAHNLKLSYDFVDPSDRAPEDERERYSIVWEYTPIQLFQARTGMRFYNGVPSDALSNRDELFVEMHVFF